MSGTRLAALTASFGAFGQAAANINTLINASNQVEEINARVDHQLTMKGIQQENERVGNQAAADAGAGREADPALNEQRVYRETFAAVTGQRTGFDLAQRWRSEVLDRAPIGANITALTNQWMRTAVGRGTGDATFDRHAMDVLSRAVQTGIGTHREEGARAVLEQGQQSLRSLIGSAVAGNQFNAESFGQWVQQASVLARGDRNRAQAFVVSAMEEALPTGNEVASTRFLTSLAADGSGVNGRSWRADNEQAYQALEGRLMQRVQHSRTVAGQSAYNAIEDDITRARTPADIAAVTERINRTFSQHGGPEDRQRVERALRTRAEPIIQQQETLNQMGRWAMGAGDTPPEPTVVRQNIDGLFAALPREANNPEAGIGISPLTHPERAAVLVARLGDMSDTMKSQLRMALNNTADAGQQVAAMRFLRTLEQQPRSSRDTVLRLLPEGDARTTYRVMSDMLDVSSQPIDRVVAQMRELGGTNAGRTLTSTSWRDVYPSERDQAAAETRRDGQIQQGLRDYLGARSDNLLPNFISATSVQVDSTLRERLQVRAHVAAVYARNNGADVDTAVRGAIRDLQDRVDIIPTADGAARAVLRQQNADAHPDGAPIIRGGVEVRNPATGRAENTFATAQRDMTALRTSLNGLVAGGGAFALSPDPRVASRSEIPIVRVGGTETQGPLIFTPGQQLNLRGTLTTLASDPAAMAAQIEQSLPAPLREGGRVRLVPIPQVINGAESAAYQLVYRFGFTERGVTAEQRAAGTAPPATNPRTAPTAGRDGARVLENLSTGRGGPPGRPSVQAPILERLPTARPTEDTP